MAGFLFRLETANGEPAEPPTLQTPSPTGARATRFRSAKAGRCAPWTFGTTILSNRSCSSLKTWPDKPIAH